MDGLPLSITPAVGASVFVALAIGGRSGGWPLQRPKFGQLEARSDACDQGSEETAKATWERAGPPPCDKGLVFPWGIGGGGWGGVVSRTLMELVLGGLHDSGLSSCAETRQG